MAWPLCFSQTEFTVIEKKETTKLVLPWLDALCLNHHTPAYEATTYSLPGKKKNNPRIFILRNL